MKVLVIDVGGTHVKVKLSTMKEPVKIVSGPKMTPILMVAEVKKATSTWEHDRVSMGYPGVVIHDKPVHEPANLAPGWVGFDFEKAFKKPMKIVNDAAMQALGSYEGGRMLFFGLGTGLGSAMVVDHIVQPMELAHLPYKGKKTYEDVLGLRGLKKLGKKKWTEQVFKVSALLKAAMDADYVVLGGGNVDLIKTLPPDIRRGANENAFKGGVELWREPRSRSKR
jgi:polyphosphate glucokinase